MIHISYLYLSGFDYVMKMNNVVGVGGKKDSTKFFPLKSTLFEAVVTLSGVEEGKSRGGLDFFIQGVGQMSFLALSGERALGG